MCVICGQMSDCDPEHVPSMKHETRMQIQQCNWQVLNCTTAANYYHALRRQVRVYIASCFVMLRLEDMAGCLLTTAVHAMLRREGYVCRLLTPLPCCCCCYWPYIGIGGVGLTLCHHVFWPSGMSSPFLPLFFPCLRIYILLYMFILLWPDVCTLFLRSLLVPPSCIVRSLQLYHGALFTLTPFFLSISLLLANCLPPPSPHGAPQVFFQLPRGPQSMTLVDSELTFPFGT